MWAGDVFCFSHSPTWVNFCAIDVYLLSVFEMLGYFCEMSSYFDEKSPKFRILGRVDLIFHTKSRSVELSSIFRKYRRYFNVFPDISRNSLIFREVNAVNVTACTADGVGRVCNKRGFEFKFLFLSLAMLRGFEPKTFPSQKAWS